MKNNVWLGLAVSKNKLDDLKALLALGFSAGADNKEGQSLLTSAVLNHANAVLEYLLQIPLALARINEQDSNGNTPLLLAVLTENKEAVGLLLEAGADISIKNDKHEDALELAARGIVDEGGENRDLILKMLDEHAELMQQEASSSCPLM